MECPTRSCGGCENCAKFSHPPHDLDAKTVLSFEIRLDRIWKDSEVMYQHDIDIRSLTSNRNTRTNCAQPNVDIELTNEDLRQEA